MSFAIASIIDAMVQLCQVVTAVLVRMRFDRTNLTREEQTTRFGQITWSDGDVTALAFTCGGSSLPQPLFTCLRTHRRAGSAGLIMTGWRRLTQPSGHDGSGWRPCERSPCLCCLFVRTLQHHVGTRSLSLCVTTT